MPAKYLVHYDRSKSVLTLNRDELSTFLVEAKLRGYAGMGEGAYNDPKTGKGTRQFSFKKGPFTFYDEFAGDRVFFGMEKVSVRLPGSRVVLPVWFMVYGGEVHSFSPTPHEVYEFLVEALREVPKELPYRGPTNSFTSERFPKLKYTMHIQQPSNIIPSVPSLERAQGSEAISYGGLTEIYNCTFTGGLALMERGSIQLV